MADFVDVVLSHAALNTRKSTDVTGAAVTAALAHKPHVQGFTELALRHHRLAAAEAAAAAGYRFISDPAWDPALAVREDVELVESWAVQAHEGDPAPKRGAAYRPRHIVAARVRVTADVDLTVEEFHAITWEGLESRQANRLLMATKVAEQLAANSVGPRLAVAMGDTNEGDEPGAARPMAAVLDAAGIATVWDDLGHYPDTHVLDPKHPGAPVPIDWLMRNRADKRLSFLDATVIDQAESDHHQVLVTVRVKIPLPAPVQHACPVEGCGLMHFPPVVA